MENAVNIANYMFEKYKEISKNSIDEMKLHKLLYLAQRESYAIRNAPLFQGDFEGWRFGPVCKEIRMYYTPEGILCECNEISEESKYIVNNTILEYGAIESWKLSELTHKEISWSNSRKGLSPEDNGSKVLNLEDIKLDAQKVRPYDYVWDMYYDEFEDAEDC